jgi:DNA-binding NtrC family response regulator
MNILCVDDDTIILQFFADAIRELGLPDINTLCCSTGNEAIELALGRPINLIILDNKLPDLSGLEALKRIKSFKPCIEVLMVTGNASVEDAVEAMKAGARDYIEKPVRIALLHEKLLNIIELNRRGDEVEEYRFAKEAVEALAQRQITSLEEALQAMRQCRDRVLALLDANIDNAQKLCLVKREITGIDGGHY